MKAHEDQIDAAPRQRPRLWVVLVGFAATFVLGDRLIAMVTLPDTTSNTKAPVRMLEGYTAMSPPADVVFVGCSYTAFGIDPAIVDASAAAAGVPVRSLNLGYGGAVSLTSTRLCELMLNSDHPPRVIYYELNPGILNSRLPSLRYGVEQIAGPHEARVLWSVSPADRTTAVLSQTLAGFHQWNDIHAIVNCVLHGAPLYRPKYERSDRGWLEWQGGRDNRDRTITKEIAKRDVYWGDFRVEDFALDAVRRVAALAEERGVIVRFFELPMASEWRYVIRDDVRSKYEAALAELQSPDWPGLWQCPEGLVSDEDYFDSDHLMPQGAEKVSRVIADDLVGLLKGQADGFAVAQGRD